jgi:hypothetical protein
MNFSGATPGAREAHKMIKDARSAFQMTLSAGRVTLTGMLPAKSVRNVRLIRRIRTDSA